MVDFRKALLLVAVLVCMTGVASAQVFNPLICTANAGVVPPVRSEGIAEEIGQIVINCTGGNPTAVGLPISTVNVEVKLNTTVTSRLLGSSTASEAMLLIDEPAPAIQFVCLAPGNCPLTSANGDGTGNYTGIPTGRPNIWQGVQSSSNGVVFLGVPVDPPGSIGNRVLRIANIRANANLVGAGSGFTLANIQAFISISGTGSLALQNPLLTVAYVQKGMKFSASGGTFNQCEPGTYEYDITFTELFGTAFRNNNPLNAVTVTEQSTPGVIYNTESMFSNNGTLPTGAGVATQGTRLIARFSDVPANVTLKVANSATSDHFDIANIVSTDSNGAGGTPDYTGAAAGTTTVALSGGAGMAVWEVIASTPGSIDGLTFTVTVTYGSNPLPGLGTATVTGNYAPISTTSSASQTAPVPRFVNDPTSATTFTIAPCQTNLLFPYVTNYNIGENQFDTGIAIANTSLDPFGTAPQNGPCTLYYYGTTASGGVAPSPQTSGTINGGSLLAFTLSNGGNLGIDNRGAGFTGYIIARCNFQFAHGYAFISNPGGITRWAQGYVALVLDEDMYDGGETRTGVQSEVLSH